MESFLISDYPPTQIMTLGENQALIQNADLNNNIYLGKSPGTNASDLSNVVPLTPQSYVVLDGSMDVWGVCDNGLSATLNKIPGGSAFFQSGISGETIIINKNGLFIYTSNPSIGDLVAAIAGATGSDQFGNPFLGPGLGIYGVGGNTSSIFLGSVNGIPELEMFTNTLFESKPANFASGLTGSGAAQAMLALLSGPKASSVSDWTQIELVSNNQGGTAIAKLFLNYIDSTGGVHGFLTEDASGINISSGSIIATQPGTGTSPSNPATPAAWTNLGLINGYTSGANNGFSDVPQIRLMADNKTLQFKGTLVSPAAPTSAIFSQIPTNFPNANLGGPFGMGLIANLTGGTVEHVEVHNNGNIGLNASHANITFDLSCIVPTQ